MNTAEIIDRCPCAGCVEQRIRIRKELADLKRHVHHAVENAPHALTDALNLATMVGNENNNLKHEVARLKEKLKEKLKGSPRRFVREFWVIKHSQGRYLQSCTRDEWSSDTDMAYKWNIHDGDSLIDIRSVRNTWRTRQAGKNKGTIRIVHVRVYRKV